jgi:outer membrane protein assembly factor BamB
LAALALTPFAAKAQDGWLLFRGTPQRTSAASSLPAWEKRTAWQRPLLLDKYENFADPDKPAKDLIDRLRKGADATIFPAFSPIIVKDSCIYTSYRDLRCVPLQAQKLDQDQLAVPAGAIRWKGVNPDSALSAAAMEPKLRPGLEHLATLLEQSKQGHLLYANPMISTISADDELVYTIEDIPIPVARWKKDATKRDLFEWRRFISGNALTAYNAVSGKIVWEINRIDEAASPFKDHFFLGAPLPVEGKLYFLGEHAGALRLLTIDRGRKLWPLPGSPPLEKALALLMIRDAERAPDHLLRRTQPLHLAHADRLLVCPTNSGVLLGVDRVKMLVRWQYRYRDEKAEAPNLPSFQAACPIIHKDRIIFTAVDSPLIHCLDLDGAKKWAVPVDNDLFLATAHEDLVLLVGKTHCRALSLADGKQKWTLEMGLPAGIGVKDGSLYYVPLKRDVIAEGPAIWAIDIAKGTKARRVHVPHPDALGNLALHRGMFVSQSITHIAAFPLGAK